MQTDLGGDDSSEEGLVYVTFWRGEARWEEVRRNGETYAGQDPASKQHQQQTTAGGMQTLSCHGNATRQLIQTEANYREIKTELKEKGNQREK